MMHGTTNIKLTQDVKYEDQLSEVGKAA